MEDLNSEIVPLIDDEEDLEAEITEAEETRTRTIDGIARVKLKLNCPPTDTKQLPVLKKPHLNTTVCSKWPSCK